MPRGPRRDAPGSTHHVMIRGIERRSIFRDDRDREDFAHRLDRLVPELGFRCHAWALLPNHAHLVLTRGPVPLSRLMARLGTGYARTFNVRHRRAGHLFQNRFKSRLIEEDSDLLAVVLYVHTNPLRAHLVPNVRSLDSYRWCGHGTLVGARPSRAFESRIETLSLLAEDQEEAVRRLRRWVEDPEPALPASVDLPAERPARACGRLETRSLGQLMAEVCAARSICISELSTGRRSRRLVGARREIAARAVRELGLSGRIVAQTLGVSDATVSRALDIVRPRLASDR